MIRRASMPLGVFTTAPRQTTGALQIVAHPTSAARQAPNVAHAREHAGDVGQRRLDPVEQLVRRWLRSRW